MALVTDPHGVTPAAPTTVVSGDSRLTAVLDGANPGVWLMVTDQVTDPPRWRVTRRGPDGVDRLVRSADPVWSPGGTGVAYDDEAPLNSVVRYTAIPEYDDATVVAVSTVTLTTVAPGVTWRRDVWVTSIETPDRSALVTCSSWPALTYAANQSSVQPVGSPFPVVQSGMRTAGASQMSLFAVGAEIEFLRDVLTSGDVLLIRTLPGLHRPDQFVVVGDVSETMLDMTRDKVMFEFDLTQVDRPDTAGQRLRVPGWSNATVLKSLASYGVVASAFPSWLALASNGVFNPAGPAPGAFGLSDAGSGAWNVFGTGVVDNGDGTGTVTSTQVTDNGDGTATLTEA